jgi:glycerophosphoryl diester phosphodiesterase
MPNIKTRLKDAALVLAVGAATCFGVTRMLSAGGPPAPLSAAFAENGLVLIGHALGGVDGKTYSNSREAFFASIAGGRRLLEVDLQTLKDGAGALHDDTLDRQMGVPLRAGDVTVEDFLSRKVYGTYTPLSWGGLLDLMAEHPGVTVITDTKDGIGPMFDLLAAEARAKDPRLLDRIVPQIYGQKDLEKLNAVHRFPQAAVTMSERRFSAALAAGVRREGRDAFVHTVNDRKRVEYFLDRGATGAYTDFLFAADFR